MSLAAPASGVSDGATNSVPTVASPAAAAAADTTHNVPTLNTHNTAHTGNTSPTLPSLSRSFLTNERIKKAYDTPFLQYKNLCDAIMKEHRELQRFETRCAGHPDGTRTLPNSIGLPTDLVKKMRFTPVNESLAFYEAELKAIRAVQTTVIETVYTNLLSAKKRHLELLTSRLDTTAYISKVTNEYEQSTLTDWFNVHDNPVVRMYTSAEAMWTTGVSTVQEKTVDGHTLAQYAQHFQMTLLTNINKYCADRRMELFNHLQNRKEANAANTDAQERIMKGATTGETLAMLSQFYVDQALKKKHPQITPRNSIASFTPSKSIPVAAAAASSSNSKPQRAQAPDRHQPSIKTAFTCPPSFNIHPDATGFASRPTAAGAASATSVPSIFDRKRRSNDRDDTESQQPHSRRQKRSNWNPQSVIAIPDSQDDPTPMEEDDTFETPAQSDFHYGGGPTKTHRSGNGRGRERN